MEKWQQAYLRILQEGKYKKGDKVTQANFARLMEQGQVYIGHCILSDKVDFEIIDGVKFILFTEKSVEGAFRKTKEKKKKPTKNKK